MENDYDPAPDLSSDDPWVTPDIEVAIKNLMELMYEQGCVIKGTVISLPTTPGSDFVLDTDFGHVTIRSEDSL